MITINVTIPPKLPGDMAFDVRDFASTFQKRYPDSLVVVQERPLPPSEAEMQVSTVVEAVGSGDDGH